MTDYLDRPANGWFPLDVMRREQRGWDWVALMVNYDPDDYEKAQTAQRARTARECWLIIPGKHKSRDAAWDALENWSATRH